MRHNKKRGMKLGTDASHTKAIKNGLVSALLTHDRIKTTIERAKAIRPDVDRIITWAKKGDLASRRNAISKLNDPALVSEVFQKAAQGMWADRNGGYTRIMKLGARKGDNAEVVIIELVNETLAAKATEAPATVTKVTKVVEKTDEVAADAAEADDVKIDEAAADDAKIDEVVADDPKADDAKVDEAVADEAKAEEPKAE
ncbi:50S ribosomal protein L17 [Atopobium deltae]|uniref:50S ribosomal protein L17 n=1 Tax=Atopobium deltae TaxID=1393034 RepID=A0A133XQ00_9ACTN|nr:50S ribosomal protein L17 [Atopobium deltae]KXB33017.1 ribosomal protein L17 [Atopobium deltae]